MMTFDMKRPVTLVAGASVILLTACGGGGSAVFEDVARTGELAAVTTPFAFSDGVFTAKVLSLAEGTTTSIDGVVDTATGEYTLDDISGIIDVAANTATITDGGGVEISSDATEYVGLFDASPQDDNRTFGVIGTITETEDLPTGDAFYIGSTDVAIIDVLYVYDLTGRLELDVDFDAASPTVITALSDLDGTRTDGISDAENVTDVATITVTDSVLDGAGFSGGIASLTSNDITSLSDVATTTLEGGFYGPEGEEVGGVGLINDTADVSFTFTGRR